MIIITCYYTSGQGQLHILDHAEASCPLVLGVGQQKDTRSPFSELVEWQLLVLGYRTI